MGTDLWQCALIVTLQCCPTGRSDRWHNDQISQSHYPDRSTVLSGPCPILLWPSAGLRSKRITNFMSDLFDSTPIQTPNLLTQETSGLHSGYVSKVPLQCFFAQFYVQGLSRRCLWGVESGWRERRQKAPLKWPLMQPIRIVLLIANSSPLWWPPFCKIFSANQSCSFDCKWWPPMEVAIFKAELCSE